MPSPSLPTLATAVLLLVPSPSKLHHTRPPEPDGPTRSAAADPGDVKQTVTLDEGAFRLSHDQEFAGREEFVIQRSGRGDRAQVILRGTVRMDLPRGQRSMAPALKASGPDLRVTDYQIKVSGDRSTEVYLTRDGRRFMAKIISPEGEQLREFRAGPGSVILDPYVAHQYYLLSPLLEAEAAVSVNILSPRETEQLRGTLTQVGEEEVRVGTELVMGRHFRLDVAGEARHIWFDGQGRVLKVEIPSLAYLAEREALP